MKIFKILLIALCMATISLASDNGFKTSIDGTTMFFPKDIILHDILYLLVLKKRHLRTFPKLCDINKMDGIRCYLWCNTLFSTWSYCVDAYKTRRNPLVERFTISLPGEPDYLAI